MEGIGHTIGYRGGVAPRRIGDGGRSQGGAAIVYRHTGTDFGGTRQKQGRIIGAVA